MSLRQILASLRDGQIGVAEARMSVVKPNGFSAPNGARKPRPTDDLQESLRESLAAALYMDAADVRTDVLFTDLGLDSIIGVEWIRAVNKQWGLKIPATRLYDHPSVAQFAAYIATELFVKQPVKDPGPAREQTAAAAPARIKEPSNAPGGIAIVGVSGRYPGARDLRQFWDNLQRGRNSIVEIPAQRWDFRDYFDPDRTRTGKIYCKQLGALDEIDCFDASFFMIPPAEAEAMDPQHRIFLEEAWKAFEDAGYGPQMLSGKKCGVYMGVMNSEYVHLLSKTQAAGLNTGNSFSIAAARVSYHLNLKGPAIPIDTACSSSLVATHLACQALRNGEIDMALVGGVTLYLTPASYVGMCAAGMLSPDGQCKAFDESADGFVPGEGVGLVVLKRLEDALRDGDQIHGVIIGSGINQDGRTNGITAPSVQSQIELERDIYERFAIDPETIGYVETHGTGTKLGDPIELEALTAAFREKTLAKNFCALGSVKSNIGHTSAAAGMASLHKALLSLKHKQLAPSLHFQQPNAHCDFDDSPFYVNTRLKPWDSGEGRLRRAAVSSFGFSGTNAHLVVEEFVDSTPMRATRGPVPVVLSARDGERLREIARHLLAWIEAPGETPPSLEDVAYTLQTGREAMQERVAWQVESLEELANRLARFVAGEPSETRTFRGRVARSRGRLATFEADGKTLVGIGARSRAGDYAALLELWVTGLAFDWETLHAERRGRRVSLPSYPFAKERHWVGGAKPEAATELRLEPPRGPAIALVAPEDFSGGPTPLAAIPRPLILPPLEPPDAPPIRMETRERGDGVVFARVDGANRLTTDTSDELKALGGRTDVRVIVLEGDGVFSLESRDVEVPVIGVGKDGAGAPCDLAAPDAEAALELAQQVARAPRQSLVLLKQHLAGFGAPLGEDPFVRAAFGAKAGPPQSSEAAALRSNTVKLETFASGVALLTLRDAESRNTFSQGLAHGLQEAFAHVGRTRTIKVLVLTGFGNYFACGGTREALIAIQAGQARFTDSEIVSLPLTCEIPVIAAMQGHAIGAGWTLGMFSDASVLSAESIYHSPYMQFGFTPGAGATLVFPLRFGPQLAREILFSAREYKGQELERRAIGLPVLPRVKVLPKALAAAHHLARSSRDDLVRWKRERAQTLRERLAATYAAELAMHEKTFVGSPEVLERIEALYRAPFEAPMQTSAREERPDGDATKSLVQTLRETLAAELHMKPEKVDVEVAFVELGLDSINTITWLREANRRLGLSLTAMEVYSHPTVLELARHISRESRAHSPRERTEAPAVEPASAVKRRAENPSDIAVIGMSGRLPKSPDIRALWDNLAAGRDCVSEVGADRWPLAKYFDPDPQAPGKTYSKWMGALEDFDKFDPLFFAISPLEAEEMDPQQRLFLEACWTCIEDAGYDPLKLTGTRCGVFAGCGPGDYGLMAGGADGESLDPSALTGGSTSILAARISYFLNLQGPCIAMDTACSSSLVAIASACDSLVLGTSDLALAGGVSVMASPMMHVMTSKAGMLSPDGRCFAFDQRANGFVPGEGVGVVLLKRLADAERDGDRVDAIVRGWGVNQDGKTNGITAPNGDSQTRLEKYVYDRFGLNPETIQLVEAHGTGTKLGDPIEVAALTSAFRAYTDRTKFCALGTVKSNAGHLLAAAGVAGFIKAALALKHRTLPPTINFNTLNERIASDGSPFYVNTVRRNWDVEADAPRRAAVNSFGFSGTNAHAVLEESFEKRAVEQDPSPVLIVLSAKDADRLRQAVANLLGYLENHFAAGGGSLQDVAYTLQVGRTPMSERLALVVESETELKAALRRHLHGDETGFRRGRVKRDDVLCLAATEAATGDLSQLAQAWVTGAQVDWSRLHGPQKRRRLSLPTYPFARERFWREARNEPSAPVEERVATLLCRPVWKTSLPAVPPEDFSRHIILPCGSFASQAALIARALPEARCVAHSGGFEDVACAIFETIKGLLREGQGKTLLQVLIGATDEQPLLAGLSGLLRTAALENPAFCGQLIEWDSGGDVAAALIENRARPRDARVRYASGKREVLTFEEMVDAAAQAPPCWRDRGVYLIMGGAGALGRLMAREIAAKANHPTLILAGRSALDGSTRSFLDTLRSRGAQAFYRQADAGDETSVQELFEGVQADFGHLDAVLHLAGIHRDNFIARKPASEFRQVLAAKTRGAIAAERAARALSLELIVLFSSCAGVTGNPGQADYACANAFLDAFARSRFRAGATRVLSIDWPYWENGGMRLDDLTLAAMKERTGAAPLATDAAMQALYRAVASGLPQIMVLAGDAARLRESLLHPQPPDVMASEARPSSGSAARRAKMETPVEASPSEPGGNVAITPLLDGFASFAMTERAADRPIEPAISATPSFGGENGNNELRHRIVARLKSLLGETLHLSVERIDENEPLENYGLDSILVKQLNLRLGRVFPELSQTLLFEVRTLSELASRLAEAFRDDGLRWTGFLAAEPKIAAVAEPAEPTPVPAVPLAEARVGVQQPVAIIGIAGHYADAEDLDDFWEILKSGRDCVTTIPEERWPLDGFYHADPDEAVARGKSYGKWGSFLDGFAEFDPLFFNISPAQAMGMDPQERLFLQTAWEAVESAGLTRARMAESVGGRVGVFVGVTKTGFDKHAPSWKRRGVAAVPHTSFGSIANRVSYVLDLKGPSLPIDTMCSSSLTAIHAACQSLRQGECAMAIAGGVNLYLHPSSYVELSAQRMLSTDGRCKSFGDGGNGLVPGEGVGAVLLKPLAAALADGDPIHAVIRGTHVNHGGRTNGYTVPNPKAQADLVREAFDLAGVDASAVTYIEAHGTGTALGDPIEVAGLTQAFQQDTSATGFCLLGSVKSNLGHLEAAAGIAGLSKVVLQMRHGQIAPSLHASALNSTIPFERTPFVVARELSDWAGPRLAGVSSFGAGGANAHVVLEAPPPAPPDLLGASDEPELVVLSAKTEDRLLAYGEKLHRFLSRHSANPPNLRDLAFTLQTGREAMEWRVGFIVRSLDELKEKLNGFTGVRVDKGRDAFARLARDEDMRLAFDAWLRKRKLPQLLDAWNAGTPLAWEKLHGDRPPRRIELPTYPFAREKYWLPFEPEAAAAVEGAQPLHPLLHRNTSDLNGLRFTSLLSAEAPYVADHVIGGQKILPGVALLEMARAATEIVSGETAMSIANVAWMRPVVATDPSHTVHIGLANEEDGALRFEIHSTPPDGGKIVHADGIVTFGSAGDTPNLDLARLRADGKARRFEGAECYGRFEAMGVHYGPSHQSLAELFAGDGQVLARLTLPEAASRSKDAFGLHPSLLDGALQAAIGFSLVSDASSGLGASAPFALDEMRIFASCAAEAWAWIRNSPNSSAKLDFDLCDDIGKVLVTMRGVTFRPLPSQGVLLAHPIWRDAAVSADKPSPDFDERRVLVRGIDSRAVVSAERLPFDGQAIARSFEAAALRVFNLAREASSGRRTLLQIVIPSEGPESLLSGLSGLLRTARIENPLFSGQVIEVDAASAQDLPRILAENGKNPDDFEIRYAGGVRRVRQWRETDPPPAAAPWKAGGVYWITGGAGGLSRIFAGRIARDAPDAAVILTGRSPLEPEWLAGLRACGARVKYRRGDVSRAEDADRLVEEILAEHGRLDGIFHAAGITRDKLIPTKSPEELREVLAPKVAGALNLDRATQRTNLDFFALFAAGAGVLGNPGQADYACANAFLDAFASYRNERVGEGQRQGRTISVDWPLWREGGMTMDSSSQAAMREKLGLSAMATDIGLDVFARALASGLSQVMPLTGDLPRLRQLLRDRAEPSPAPPRRPVAEAETAALGFLRGLLSGALNVPEHRLGPDEPFSQFGIDSIVVMNLTHQLEKTFGSLPKTLFFEYENLRALARYFARAHRGKLPAAGEALTTAPPPPSARPALGARSREATSSRPSAPASSALDIAIVGLSGRYPMAPDLDTFWANLRDGRDCITEAPASRWNWRDYYSAEAPGSGGHSSKWGGFIDDVDKFDPQFFGISPRIAPYIDPQERLILEEAWKALEDAGYRPRDLQSRLGPDSVAEVGVYIGSMYGEYQLIGAEMAMTGAPAAFAGNLASLANRISYVLNLNGPSMMVDTMCSSSLTCLHLACQDLKQGRTRMAIAGGVNLSIHPNKYLMLSGGRFLSSQGRCESFGQGGDGYIPSEGVGVAVLKRLADAERDGDHIWGVIKGSALNHGGRTNGYSVPNPNAQRRVIAEALGQAGVGSDAVNYVEAHGTGTKLGDPIEIAGLSGAFREDRGEARCWLGSVKSNIGHCEAAAGIAGLTKILLQMKHGQIAPSIHSGTLNPNIDFDATPFEVNQTLRNWETSAADGHETPRIASISSFGAGGSNAHMVIEQHFDAAEVAPSAARGPAAIVLSARTAELLRESAQNLRAFLDDPGHAEIRLEDVAYTLQMGREPMEQRLGFSAASVEQLRGKLAKFLAGESMAPPPDGGSAEAILLSRWLSGEDVDWTSLYPTSPRPRRVSLPTSPFARQRYWVERPTATPRRELAEPAIVAPETPTPGSLTAIDLVPTEFSEGPVSPPLIELAPLSTPMAIEAQIETDDLPERLRAGLAETLYMEPYEIGFDKPFVDLGLDSIVAVEWIKRINQEFGLAITASIVYEHQNLRIFTKFIREVTAGQAAAATSPPVSAVRATDIAIIGLSGRFPGAPNPEAFWRLLEAGQTAFTALPVDRDWDLDGIYSREPQSNKTYVKRGAFLDDIDGFDPLFFQISPKEAMTMDPGERLFLEESWRAIEDAGIDAVSLSGRRWGVFCGNGGDYGLRLKEVLGFSPHVTLSQVPARVSHALDLRGPCESLDAGCASSLLAIAQACEQLAAGRCEAAVAGGALIHSTPNLLISACQVNLLSSGETGVAFGAQARGMMPGEAVGVVVLKRLADALADGDRIHGVIEGWGSNHNGRTNGLTAPNEDAEVSLFQEVHDRFGLDPASVTLVEANASGMPLADAVETRALARVFVNPDCALGTVENNVGHAFHASGMSHLAKVLLSLRHKKIPGTPNADESPASNAALSIHAKTIPWKTEPGQPRRAAINSFGATGINVHLVVREAPEPAAPAASPDSRGPALIALSARTAAGLRQRALDLGSWIGSATDLDLRRLSANLLMRRAHLSERCAFIVADVTSLRENLSRLGRGDRIAKGFAGNAEAEPALAARAVSTIGAFKNPLQPNEANLLVLADLYAKGNRIDLSACFTESEKAVLSLPVYPFEKRRCWVSPPPREAAQPKLSPALVETLKGFVCELTGMTSEEIRSDTPLKTYGVDSLMGMRLLNRINASTGAKFDASLLANADLRGIAASIESASKACDGSASSKIERVELEIGDEPEAVSATKGEAQLEALLGAGMGVRVSNRVFHFEFMNGEQSRASPQNLVTHPRSLRCVLPEDAALYPVSQMQQVALEASERGVTALDVGQAFWIDAPVDLARLNQAWNAMTREHAILRTGARRVGAQWAQVVYDQIEASCRELLWSEIRDPQSFREALEALQKQRGMAGFDTAKAPLLELFVIHNAKDLAAVYFRTHHFHADGFTLFLVQQEFYRRYRALLEGSNWTPASPRGEYAYFALTCFEPGSAANTRFWKEFLDRQACGSRLRDRSEHVRDAPAQAGVLTLEIQNGALGREARRLRPTLTQLVACATGVLVYRLTGANMAIQMVYNLRDRQEFESVLGDFSSSAPLILDVSSEMTFGDVFALYDEAVLRIQTHRRFDLGEIIGALEKSGAWSGISIDSTDRDSLCEVTDFAARMIEIPIEGRQPLGPLVVCLVKTGGRATLQLIYDKSLLSSRSLELFGEALRELLAALAESPERRIADFCVSAELRGRLAL